MSQYQNIQIDCDQAQLPDSTGVANLDYPYQNQQDPQNNQPQQREAGLEQVDTQKRKSKNYGPNLLKKFQESQQLYKKVKSKPIMRGIYFQERKVKAARGTVVKWVIRVKTASKSIWLTEMMKLLLILRLEFNSYNEKIQINDILQENVKDSIKRKRNRLKKYPQEEAQIKRAIAFYQKMSQIIAVLLFEDKQTLRLKWASFRQEFFSPAQKFKFHNAGVKQLQSKKIEENQKEIEIELKEDQWFAVLNLSNQSSNINELTGKVQEFNISQKGK